MPSHGTRDVLRRAAPHIRQGSTVVSATKGLERDTLFRVSEIIEQECGPPITVAVLSGPSFAIELARELPTAVSIASRDAAVVERVQAEFRAPYFRLYGTDDVVGVEIGGALKNIIAIAAGVVEGLGLGHNALAGLITRGLAEMSRLACAAGAKRETLSGLTGLGDLVLTCTGRLSRNRHVGVELASGRALQDVLGGMKMVAEGVRTTEAALALAARYGVELPIAAQVAELLAGRKDAANGAVRVDDPSQRAKQSDRLGVDLGFLDRLREGLTRTKEQIVSRFEEIVQKADSAEQRYAAGRCRHDRGARRAADLGRCRHSRDRAHRGRGQRAGPAGREPARSGQGRDPQGLRHRRRSRSPTAIIRRSR